MKSKRLFKTTITNLLSDRLSIDPETLEFILKTSMLTYDSELSLQENIEILAKTFEKVIEDLQYLTSVLSAR